MDWDFVLLPGLLQCWHVFSDLKINGCALILRTTEEIKEKLRKIGRCHFNCKHRFHYAVAQLHLGTLTSSICDAAEVMTLLRMTAGRTSGWWHQKLGLVVLGCLFVLLYFFFLTGAVVDQRMVPREPQFEAMSWKSGASAGLEHPKKGAHQSGLLCNQSSKDLAADEAQFESNQKLRLQQVRSMCSDCRQVEAMYGDWLDCSHLHAAETFKAKRREWLKAFYVDDTHKVRVQSTSICGDPLHQT